MAVMIDSREERLYGIKLRLGAYAANAYMEQGRLSESEESLMEGLLNIILDSDLKNMNLKRENFPAIDLGDRERKLAVQVTSTGTRDKVRHTLKEFFDNGLNGQFSRLIVVVVGRAERFSTAPQVPDGFDFVPRRDVWDLAGLLREIRGLPERKLSRVDAYLRERVNLPQREERLRLPLTTSLEDGRFVGREEELEEIASRFEREHVVVLTGLGGMGKTELAIHFGRNHWFGRTYFVRFRKDWTETVIYGIADGIKDYKRENRPVEEIYADVMEVLEACGPDDLLILDNADQANMTALRRELSALKLKVLVTTRHSGEKNDFRVRRLAREELYQIFDRHGAQVSDAQRDALIEAVAGHTMTVDMIARTLADEWCNASPEEIRSAMLGSEMEEDDYPEIDTDHDGDPEQRKIYGHLRALFQLQNLKKEEEQALRCAALLPPEGMHNQLFRQALPEECRDSIRDLHRRGWVQSENKLLTIHPVVRLVCRRELKPTVENCREFLLWFRGQYDSTTYDREKFAQIAALYETASQVLGETDGFWACEAGYLWDVLVEPRRALTCNLRAVYLLEQNAPESLGLAVAYNNLGSSYDGLGFYKHALEYLLKAQTIREQVLPPDHLDLAQSYNNVGGTYGHMGDHERELKYSLKALEIWIQRLPPDHPKIARSYNNVGGAYGRLGDYKRELEYNLKALAIREHVLPPNHPELATSYNNVGGTYGDLGDHKQELEYNFKALSIREQVLSPTHPDLAQSYNNVGKIYLYQGDHKRALEYMLKALEILEQSLPADHPYNVMCRSNIAITYAKMEDFIRAFEYMDRALDSAQRSMKGHPNLEMYRQWAQILKLCAMFQSAGLPLPFDNPFQ